MRIAMQLAQTEGVRLCNRHLMQVDPGFGRYEEPEFGLSKIIPAEFSFERKNLPSPPRRFSPEQAAAIRAAYKRRDTSYRDLAREWHCSLRCINHVVKGWGAYREDP